MSGARWQDSFVATGVLLGEPPEVCVAALGEGCLCSPELLAALQSPSREVRSRALARALTRVAAALDEVRVA